MPSDAAGLGRASKPTLTLFRDAASLNLGGMTLELDMTPHDARLEDLRSGDDLAFVAGAFDGGGRLS